MNSTPDLPSSLVLVGAGKMGAAMLEGWLALGLAPAAVTVLDPNPSPELRALAAERGFRLNPAPGDTQPPEILVLAIKPQMLDAVGPGLAPLVGPGTLVLSILAGKTIAGIKGALASTGAVVRAMPNLAASIGRGATGAYASPETSARQRAAAHALLAGNGLVEWVEGEDLIDAVTAVSGSGPAYVFHLVECLAEAGLAAGLEAEVAQRLARATVEGAGELLRTSGLDPATLRQNVTSPGGTTAAALEVLMADEGLAPLMRRAVEAAKRRAGELAG
ncbi:MAG TPA: pyrroline-5-carboxylate reductase [Enterovirga sp.]